MSSLAFSEAVDSLSKADLERMERMTVVFLEVGGLVTKSSAIRVQGL